MNPVLQAELRKRTPPQPAVHLPTQDPSKNYGDMAYWDARYAENADTFEWLCGWDARPTDRGAQMLTAPVKAADTN